MNRIIGAAALFMLLGCFSAGLTFADMPPPWNEFEIGSAGGKYKAVVSVKAKIEGAAPGDLDYKISVFEIGEDVETALWSCDFDYDGYSGGMLSEDGSTFVCVNFWYYENQPVVSIYRNGEKTGTIKGKDFFIYPARLVQTVSHQLWLNESGDNSRFVTTQSAPIALEITTIDRKKHIIDLESGKFLRESTP